LSCASYNFWESSEIFPVADFKNPDISILSAGSLIEVLDMPQKNLAVELLRKLLEREIKMRRRKNIVQARSFAEMVGQAEASSELWALAG